MTSSSDTNSEAKPLLGRRRTRLESGGGDYDPGRVNHAENLYDLSRPKRRAACTAIVTTEMFERLAFYGTTANMVLFLNGDPFMWLSYEAANTLLIFLGITYMWSVIGGWIADTMLGRFKTILLSLVVYICGVALLVIVGYVSTKEGEQLRTAICGEKHYISATTPIEPGNTTEMPYIPLKKLMPRQHYCAQIIYPALLLIAIGTGSVRSNLSPFGADQVKYEGPEVMRMFFNWFYWAINLGSFVAIGVACYIQQNYNFFFGYLIPAIALVIATVVFVCGRLFYLSKKPMGSVLTNTRRIVGEAFRRRRQRKRMLSRQDSDQVLRSNPIPSFMDMAKTRFGGSFHESMVDDVKALGKIILVFLALIPYFAVYFQMQTTFLIQGLHMEFYETNDTVENCTHPSSIDHHHHNHSGHYEHSFQVPAAWLTLFDIVAVLILVPVMDRFVYPRLDKSGWNFSHLRRIAIGMVFSAVAMIVAGVLEIYRLKKIKEGPCLHLRTGNTDYYAADLSIFYQVPQYVLIGISEVFTSVAGLEFAYSQAPRSMQGLIMGLFFLAMGLGSFLSSILLWLISLPGLQIQWFNPNDNGNINFGHLDWFFFLFAGIQALGLIIFTVAMFYYERGGSSPSETGLSGPSRTPQHLQRHPPVSRGNSRSSID